MFLNTAVWIKVMLAILIAFVVSFALTPVVKILAQKVGAMDVPGEARRVHDHPIPRMGGLAIFLGFILSVVLFADITRQVRGILLGAVLIVACGAIDDIISLRAWVKLIVQIVAAVVAVAHGVVIEVLMNPNIFSENEALILGVLAVPVTVLWIVGITNSVNLIDGLDGLASSVCATVAAFTLLLAVWRRDADSTVLAAALLAGMLGFLVFNHHPAQMFMGDTGSLFLGGVIMGCAMMAGELLLFVLAGFVFVADMLTSLLQRWYFRLTHGKRLFPIAPIHHSFEKWGFGEYAVMGLFAGVSALFCVLAWFGK